MNWAEGDGFLQRTVAGDECWVFYFQPETKLNSKEWPHSSSSKHTTFCTTPWAGQLMTVSRETTVNSEEYHDCLRTAFNIQSGQNFEVCPGLMCCYSMITRDLTQHMQALSNLRIYVWSSIFTWPRTVWLSRLDPSRKCYMWRNSVPTKSLKSKEFYSRDIQALLKQWQTCNEHNGDYVEQWEGIFNHFCIFVYLYI